MKEGEEQQRQGSVPDGDDAVTLWARCDDSVEPLRVTRTELVDSSLFAHVLWSASDCLAALLDAHPELYEGANVLESGAGVALPSLVVATRGGYSRLVVTDYDEPAVLGTIRRNLVANGVPLGERGCDVYVSPLTWGVEEHARSALEFTPNAEGYQLMLFSETLWKVDAHVEQLKSIQSCLHEDGIALVCFAHHLPNSEVTDEQFFQVARRQPFGFHAECVHVWRKEQQVVGVPVQGCDGGAAPPAPPPPPERHHERFLWALAHSEQPLHRLRALLKELQ